jgi:hypothetical protein
LRGSQRWIQEWVNESPGALAQAVSAASDRGIDSAIQWLSPLAEDGYAEYRDASFLRRLDLSLGARDLADFWPKRGPQWDALGRAAGGQIVLVEAKSHVRELITPKTGAAGASLAQIEAALAETAAAFGVPATYDWTQTFYQYANRLAHLYFLRRVNGLPAWLVCVYFVGDREMGGPASTEEWRAALTVMYAALGLKRSSLLKYVVDVFLRADVDAGQRASTTAAHVG